LSFPGERRLGELAQTDSMQTQRAAVVSLELLLDADLERRIRAEWQALADARFSSLAAHTAPSNRPHITVVVRPSIPQLTREQLSEVISLPLQLEIGDPILFGGGDGDGDGERRVLARSVVPSPQLLDFHAALHKLIGDGDEDAPHTRPGDWVPHITLARRIRQADIPQALRLIDDADSSSFTPPSATALRRWDAESATITELL
jgi:2'-5' RNA ligase